MCIKPVDEFQAEHLRKAEQVRREIYRKMTPERKLEITFAMNREVRKFKASWLRQRHPNWTEVQVQDKVREIFLYART